MSEVIDGIKMVVSEWRVTNNVCEIVLDAEIKFPYQISSISNFDLITFQDQQIPSIRAPRVVDSQSRGEYSQREYPYRLNLELTITGEIA